MLDAPGIQEQNERSGQRKCVLGAGDTIAVKHLYNERLDGEVDIRPDGMISLPLVEDVRAAGLTPAQLNHVLSDAYAKAFLTSTESYSLGVGDTIAVNHLYDRDLSEEMKIRPDGLISLPLIGEVRAAGLTPAQLRTLLIDRYAEGPGTQDPEITVIVRDFRTPEVTVNLKRSAAERVYVGGEVAQEMMIPIQGALRVLDAIIIAGGTLDTAKLKTVILVRYNGTQKPDAYSLDLNKVIAGELPDVMLKPYDIVYVPKTTIAKVNVYVDQYFHKMMPRNVMFNFPYYLGGSVFIEPTP